LKKAFVLILKIGLSAAIIGWLVVDAAGTKSEDGENVFQKLVDQQKHWDLLAAAWLFCAGAVLLTLIRWWYLARAVGIPWSLPGALRLGFLGYLFNLAPFGIVGGDLLKAVMLAREHRQQKAKAFASVVIDRMVGLYMLFIVASVAIVATGFWRMPNQKIRIICVVTFGLTAVGAVAIAVLLTPGVTDGRGTRALARLPKIGPTIENLIEAVRIYRRKLHLLAIASAMSVGVHCLFATGIYLIAHGLYDNAPSLPDHLVISPLSATTGVLPLPMGPFEAVLEFLYRQVGMAAYRGLIVALGYRLICVLIATVGICYYLGSRREIAQVMHEAA